MKDLDTQAGPIAGLVYCEQEKAVLVACQVRAGDRTVIRRRTTLLNYIRRSCQQLQRYLLLTLPNKEKLSTHSGRTPTINSG